MSIWKDLQHWLAAKLGKRPESYSSRYFSFEKGVAKGVALIDAALNADRDEIHHANRNHIETESCCRLHNSCFKSCPPPL